MILLKSLLFESDDTIKNKEAIIAIFRSNPKLSDIGNIKQYSDYINTIFPDSKVKGILYHASNEKNHLTDFTKINIGKEKNQIDTFNDIDIKLNHEYLTAGNGYYFTKDKDFIRSFSDKITYVVLNLKHPVTLNTSDSDWLDKSKSKRSDIIKKLLNVYDSIIDTAGLKYYKSDELVSKNSPDYIVYNKRLIYILGSKHDISEFKKFVSNKPDAEKEKQPTDAEKEKQPTDDETKTNDDFSLVNIAQDAEIIGILLASSIINLLTPTETKALEEYPSETTNGDEVMKFFLNKGLSTIAAAGITGNLNVESESWQTGKIGDDGTSMGLAQWHDTRLARMIKWTMENGYSPKSVTGQLEYLWYELTTKYTSALTAINNAKTAYDAGIAFAKKYEKPAVISTKRGNYAEKYYKQYSNNNK